MDSLRTKSTTTWVPARTAPSPGTLIAFVMRSISVELKHASTRPGHEKTRCHPGLNKKKSTPILMTTNQISRLRYWLGSKGLYLRIPRSELVKQDLGVHVVDCRNFLFASHCDLDQLFLVMLQERGK